MDSQLVNFFKEALNRLGSKSPKFFFITRMIGISLAAAGKLPWALDRYTNIEPTEQFINVCSDIGLFFAGVFGASFLPTKSAAVAQTESGEAIKVTDENKFPFTASAESKEMEKTKPPPPVISDVPDPQEIPNRD